MCAGLNAAIVGVNDSAADNDDGVAIAAVAIVAVDVVVVAVADTATAVAVAADTFDWIINNRNIVFSCDSWDESKRLSVVICC